MLTPEVAKEKKITKRWQNALERVFAAEIHGRLPLQSKAKVFDELAAEGMVEPMDRTVGTGVWKITIRGWQLTELGRFVYGVCCYEPEELDAHP